MFEKSVETYRVASWEIHHARRHFSWNAAILNLLRGFSTILKTVCLWPRWAWNEWMKLLLLGSQWTGTGRSHGRIVSEARLSFLSNPPQSRNSNGNRDSLKNLAPRRKQIPALRLSLPLWIAPKFQFACVYSFKEYNFIAETRELMFTLGIVISWKIQSKYEQ